MTFDDSLAALAAELALPVPQSDEGLVPLEIDGHTCHLAELPAGYMLMFICLDGRYLPAPQQMMTGNLFGPALDRPVVGYDGLAQQWVIWSRQRLDEHCDAQTLRQQLARLCDSASELSKPRQPAARALR